MIFYNFTQNVSRDGVASLMWRYGVEDDEVGFEPEENTLPRWLVREPPFGCRRVDIHDVIRWLEIAPWSNTMWRVIDGQLVSQPAESDIGTDGACRCGCGWEAT